MSVSITATFIGIENLEKAIARSVQRINADVANEIALGALDIHSSAVRSIQAKSGGQSEVRYDPTRTVTVSLPGDPPNTDTGRLVQSIQFDVDKDKMKASVGTNLLYGAWLEFGTERMGARPWLLPAYLKEAPKMVEAIKNIVKKALAK